MYEQVAVVADQKNGDRYRWIGFQLHLGLGGLDIVCMEGILAARLGQREKGFRRIVGKSVMFNVST